MKYQHDAAPRDVVVHTWGIRRLIGWSEEHEAELRRQQALRLRLTELAREADQRYADLVATYAPLAAATKEAATTWAAYDGLCERRAGREIIPAEALTAAKTAFAGARDRRQAALQAAKKTPVFATGLAQLRTEHETAIRAAVRASGVYYDTANAIRQAHATAYQRLLADRATGRAAEMTKVPEDGGHFVNQLKGGGQRLAMFLSGAAVPATIAGDRLTIIAASRIDGAPRELTRVRNGKTETVLWRAPGERLPLTIELSRRGKPQPWPDDDELRIKRVAVVLRADPDWRPGMPAHRRWRASRSRVVVTATLPGGRLAATAPRGLMPIAVDFGWRKMADGSLRVATVRGATTIAGLLYGGEKLPLLPDSPAGHVTLRPADLLQAQRMRLQQEDDRAVNARRAALDAVLLRLRALPWPTAPAPIRDRGMRLAGLAWPPIRETAELVLAWATHAPGWCPDDLAALEAWRREDIRMRHSEEAATRQFLGRRLDRYRRAAKQIALAASVIIIGPVKFTAPARRRRDIDDPINPTVRRHQRWAAPGELLQALRNAARRYGREIVEQSGSATWHCHIGDHPIAPGLPQDLRYFCDRCRAWLDQDENACLVRLTRHFHQCAASATARSGLEM